MNEEILLDFDATHLPAALADVVAPFMQLATRLLVTLPRTPDRAVALRKLLEAKDAAVRAALTKLPDEAPRDAEGLEP